MRGRRLLRCATRAGVGAVLLAATTGCDTTVQETLGLGKRAPDEFQVVRRAPLVLPPDMNLRPPRPGAVGGSQPDASAEAREILTGTAEAGDGDAAGRQVADLGPSASGGERALVAASPVRAEPNVRERIVADDAELTRLDRRLFLLILDFQRAQFGRGNEVLDPAAEAARIRSGGGAAGSVATVRTGSAPLPADSYVSP